MAVVVSDANTVPSIKCTRVRIDKYLSKISLYMAPNKSFIACLVEQECKISISCRLNRCFTINRYCLCNFSLTSVEMFCWESTNLFNVCSLSISNTAITCRDVVRDLLPICNASSSDKGLKNFALRISSSNVKVSFRLWIVSNQTFPVSKNLS
jgi:hypothetical protein